MASKEEKCGGPLEVGCEPFHDKIFGIEIVASSEPVFSPDSEYGVKNVIRPKCSPEMIKKFGQPTHLPPCSRLELPF